MIGDISLINWHLIVNSKIFIIFPFFSNQITATTAVKKEQPDS